MNHHTEFISLDKVIESIVNSKNQKTIVLFYGEENCGKSHSKNVLYGKMKSFIDEKSTVFENEKWNNCNCDGIVLFDKEDKTIPSLLQSNSVQKIFLLNRKSSIVTKPPKGTLIPMEINNLNQFRFSSPISIKWEGYWQGYSEWEIFQSMNGLQLPKEISVASIVFPSLKDIKFVDWTRYIYSNQSKKIAIMVLGSKDNATKYLLFDHINQSLKNRPYVEISRNYETDMPAISILFDSKSFMEEENISLKDGVKGLLFSDKVEKYILVQKKSPLSFPSYEWSVFVGNSIPEMNQKCDFVYNYHFQGYFSTIFE